MSYEWNKGNPPELGHYLVCCSYEGRVVAIACAQWRPENKLYNSHWALPHELDHCDVKYWGELPELPEGL